MHGCEKEQEMGKTASPLLTAEHNYAPKSPLVTMGCPTFTPKLPFPSTISTPSNTPILRLPKTASRSNQPFCHSTPSSTPTDKWARRQVCTMTRLRYSVYSEFAKDNECTFKNNSCAESWRHWTARLCLMPNRPTRCTQSGRRVWSTVDEHRRRLTELTVDGTWPRQPSSPGVVNNRPTTVACLYCQNELNPFSRFETIPACDKQIQKHTNTGPHS